MSDGPSRRRVLFDETEGEDASLAAVRRGEMMIGEALAGLREARGLGLGEIAAHLRIRETFLAALESGDLNRLPGPTYAIGFVRSYANFLGLDGEEAVRLFKEARTGEGGRAALVFPEPVTESRIPKGAVLFLSVVLAAAAYGGWYYLSSHDMEFADLVPQVPAALRGGAPDAPQSEPEAAASQSAAPRSTPSESAASESAVPEPVAPEPAAPEPDAKAKAPEAAEAPAAAPQAEPSAPAAEAPPLESPSAPAAAPETPSPQPPAASAPAEPAPAPPPPAAAPAAPSPGTGESQTAARPPVAEPGPIELRARGDSWIQIRGQAGRVVVMRILRPGDIYRVPDEPGLTLMTGNAGAIEIRVDGEVVPAIGPMGAVRRDVALDPERLRAGKAVGR